MTALVGKVLGQNYRVLEPIGAGAMGMVFVVEHVNLPKRFAAKVLTPDLARHPEAIARFEMEAHAVSQLEHENIVSVVDYGRTDDGCVFIIMELLRGKTLQARVDQGPLPVEEIVAIVMQVCRALAAAHAAGIVHRDMKPDNVFLAYRPGGRPIVKVLDFGVSKARESTLRDGRITRQGQILGSPEYMSPEASRGEEVDARADVYAVGIMLYQLLCGDVPFRHENYLKVLQMHVTQLPIRPRTLVPDLPDALEQLIMRALEKDPALRHPSIEHLELELIAALPEAAHRAMSAAEMGQNAPWARTSTQPIDVAGDIQTVPVLASVEPQDRADGTTLDIRRRRRAVIIGLAGAASAIAVAIGLTMWLDRGESKAAPPPAERAAMEEPAGPGEAAAIAAVEPSAPAAAAEPPIAPPAPAATIQLEVDSTPRGATVLLDGRRLGRTPLDTHVPSADGEVDLELELRGHRTIRRSIALDRDVQFRGSFQREVKRKAPGGRAEPASRETGISVPVDAPPIKERR